MRRHDPVSMSDQCMKLWKPAYFVGAQATITSLLVFYHHLEFYSQSIKPTVERLSYTLQDSSISRDPHLLTQTSRGLLFACFTFLSCRSKADSISRSNSQRTRPSFSQSTCPNSQRGREGGRRGVGLRESWELRCKYFSRCVARLHTPSPK